MNRKESMTLAKAHARIRMFSHHSRLRLAAGASFGARIMFNRSHRPVRRLAFGILTTLLLATASPASAQVTCLWEALPNSQLGLDLPSPQPTGTVGAIVNGWGGATFDTLRNQLLILASGGNNYA